MLRPVREWGLGRLGWSQLFLVLGITAAMSVIVLDSGWAGALTSIIGVELFCALGFAVGWLTYHALQPVIPAGLFGGGTR